MGLSAEMIRLAAAPPARAAQEALEPSSLRAEHARRLRGEDLRRAHEDGVVVEVDWHDFVVVETVRFGADEGAPDEPFLAARPAVLVGAAAPAAIAASPVTTPSLPREALPPRPRGDNTDADNGDEAVRIVPGVGARVRSAPSADPHVVVHPLTGRMVHVSDLEESMRIQLMDPRWARERKRALEKRAGSNLAGGDVVAENVARFKWGMGDMFGISVSDRRRCRSTSGATTTTPPRCRCRWRMPRHGRSRRWRTGPIPPGGWRGASPRRFSDTRT